VSNLTVAEDSGMSSFFSCPLVFCPGGGSDEASQTLTYKVTAVPSSTLGNIVLADGTTMVTAGTEYTLAQINGMQFKTVQDANGGPATFSFTVTDNGTTNGVADPKTLTESLTITVTAVNDPPVNQVPSGTLTTAQDTALPFTGSDTISVSDVDALPTDQIQITLTGVHGEPTIYGVTVSGSHLGTISNLNEFLSHLAFTPETGYTGLASLTITTDDLGHNGAGCNKTDTDTISITVGSTLLAADGQATVTLEAAPLSQADLQPIVNEAIARWTALGLPAQALNAMAKTKFIVADLPDAELGLAGGGTIYLDRDAAGHGWFVDNTPAKDEEFARFDTLNQLRAIDPRAVDRMDLLTVVEHELGHIAGLDDLDSFASSLMSNSLDNGIRRAASAKEVEAFFAGSTLLD